LLSPDLMALRHLCHARTINPCRLDNLEIAIFMAEASPLSSKNFAPHRSSSITDVADDVIKQIS
jgi:hypothetical protein